MHKDALPAVKARAPARDFPPSLHSSLDTPRLAPPACTERGRMPTHAHGAPRAHSAHPSSSHTWSESPSPTKKRRVDSVPLAHAGPSSARERPHKPQSYHGCASCLASSEGERADHTWLNLQLVFGCFDSLSALVHGRACRPTAAVAFALVDYPLARRLGRHPPTTLYAACRSSRRFLSLLPLCLRCT